MKKNFDFNILHNEQNFVNEYDKSFDDQKKIFEAQGNERDKFFEGKFLKQGRKYNDNF